MNLNYYKVTGLITTELILATDKEHAAELFERVYGAIIEINFIEVLIASPRAYYSGDK